MLQWFPYSSHLLYVWRSTLCLTDLQSSCWWCVEGKVLVYNLWLGGTSFSAKGCLDWLCSSKWCLVRVPLPAPLGNWDSKCLVITSTETALPVQAEGLQYSPEMMSPVWYCCVLRCHERKSHLSLHGLVTEVAWFLMSLKYIWFCLQKSISVLLFVLVPYATGKWG